MGLELRLAWRNVWRNPRRTGLTVAATVFAVLLVVVFVAMGAGTHEQWIEDSVRVGSGHVSLAGQGYLENRTLEQFVHLDPELAELLDATPAVAGWAPRVVAFALLSKDISTHGAAILGVDPEREASVSSLAQRLRQGRFLERAGAREIVLGERLASSLGASVGDEILVYSFAYSLETAYDLFRVVGIVRLPVPELDRGLALIHLVDAQDFFVYGDRVSEVAILAEDDDHTQAIAAALRAGLSAEPPAEVYTWRQAMPEVEQMVFLDDAGMYLMLAILVVVVAFGILNTILMAVLERKREIGVCLALGLRPGAVFRMIYIESLLLALVGLALGLAVALPLVLYLVAHPIELGGGMGEAAELFGVAPRITFKLKPLNPIGSTLTICAVALVAALYPALKASRGRPVDVLRSL
jgi:putative ABC transport system permease protein